MCSLPLPLISFLSPKALNIYLEWATAAKKKRTSLASSMPHHRRSNLSIISYALRVIRCDRDAIDHTTRASETESCVSKKKTLFHGNKMNIAIEAKVKNKKKKEQNPMWKWRQQHKRMHVRWARTTKDKWSTDKLISSHILFFRFFSLPFSTSHIQFFFFIKSCYK